MNMIKSKSRNRLSMPSTEMLIYVRCNLDILNRSVDHTSSNSAVFALDEADSDDDEEEEIPNAWRDDDDDGDEPEEPPVAAVARSQLRGSHVQKNKGRVPELSAAEKAKADKEEAEAVDAYAGGRVRRPKKIFDNSADAL